MQVKLDDEVLYEIDDHMLKVLAHDLIDPIAEIKRRLEWVIKHKCEQCEKRIEEEAIAVLQADPSVEAIPKNKKNLVEMAMKRPEYKNRAQREEAILRLDQ
jgi:hypothetical protein